jgi:hypothetical protein
MLERFDLGTENEALRIAYARDRGQHIFADAIVLAAQVKQRNRLGQFHLNEILAGRIPSGDFASPAVVFKKVKF